MASQIVVQTEKSSEFLELFGASNTKFSGSEIVINGIIVHKMIVCAKCTSIDEGVDKGQTTFNFENEYVVVEGLLKLLYGFRLSITIDRLYDILLFASMVGYVGSSQISAHIMKNLTNLSIDRKMKFAKNNHVIPENFVNNLSLNDIKTLTPLVKDSDTEFLRLFVFRVLNQYKTTTTELKEHIKKLDTEISGLKQQIQKLENNEMPRKATTQSPSRAAPSRSRNTQDLYGEAIADLAGKLYFARDI